MAEPAAYLVVALSGRALTLAARRAGKRALALDLFGDTDTRNEAVASEVVAGSLAHGFDADVLLDAAERLAPAGSRPPFGVVYGSGLEDRPQLIERLARGRRLCGNSPETVARVKDPRAFFSLLARLGIPCPETSFTVPSDPSGWLAKRVGASGGSHVAPAAQATEERVGRYYQRRVAGRPIGVSFLADGRRATILGYSEQWHWTGGGASFLFGGALQPAEVSSHIVRDLPVALDALVAALGLVGLNSLDMMVDHDSFAVIEVNPRPGANLDIFDGPATPPLFELHLRACAGDLPAPAAPGDKRGASAMAVVYAIRDCAVPDDIDWPDWVADRPAPGARIDRGAPACTVLARAATAGTVRALADERVAMVLSWLDPAAADRPVAADAVVNG